MKPSTTKYFDADTMIANFEKRQGVKASAFLVGLTKEIEGVVNQAYEDGYRDGRRSLLPAADMSQDETILENFFLDIDAPEHLLGYPMVMEAILIALSKWPQTMSLTDEIYPKVAEAFDSNSPRVEHAIRTFIERLWLDGDYTMLDLYFKNTVDPGKGRPTNKQFIYRMANIVRQGGEAR